MRPPLPVIHGLKSFYSKNTVGYQNYFTSWHDLTSFRSEAKKTTVAEASTPEHKHDTIWDKGSGVEVFCSVNSKAGTTVLSPLGIALSEQYSNYGKFVK